MQKWIQFEQEKHERRQRNFVKVGGEEERRRREHLAQKLDYLPEDYQKLGWVSRGCLEWWLYNLGGGSHYRGISTGGLLV